VDCFSLSLDEKNVNILITYDMFDKEQKSWYKHSDRNLANWCSQWLLVFVRMKMKVWILRLWDVDRFVRLKRNLGKAI